MFFNMKMRNAYSAMDPNIRNIVFPNGEKEYIYVASLLKKFFWEFDLKELLSNYASIKTYFGMNYGNYYGILNFSKKKLNTFSDEDIYTMMAIAMSALIPGTNFTDCSGLGINSLKTAIKSELAVVFEIKNYPNIFNTKNNDEIGSIDNPILVSGACGVDKYISRLVSYDGKELNCIRENSIYLTDEETKIDYAVDKYTIVTKEDGTVEGTLYFNEYGTDICELCPKGYRFKDSSLDGEEEQSFSEYDQKEINNESSSSEYNMDNKYNNLIKLKELLDAGIITKEEFDKEKGKILK